MLLFSVLYVNRLRHCSILGARFDRPTLTNPLLTTHYLLFAGHPPLSTVSFLHPAASKSK
jgi:hypothetical protein